MRLSKNVKGLAALHSQHDGYETLGLEDYIFVTRPST
jgi:hypothetical protein